MLRTQVERSAGNLGGSLEQQKINKNKINEPGFLLFKMI